ncbi:hypothetical protein NIES4101_74690 [Calothrix sp. NIES-4101]|nr:hypothetical protein NIES4101_74690 [Calothrix sp. NIES-4101]
MLLHIKRKLFIGASLATTISAIASSPAFATSLARPTDIQFFTNETQHQSTDTPNIGTWTFDPTKSAEYDNSGIGGVNRQKLNDITSGNINKAISALTDNSSATNVELFTKGETIVDHVGFTAKLGKNTVRVESVTQADWADGKLANSWLTGFRNTYGTLMSSIPTTPGSTMLQDFDSNYGAIINHLRTTGFNTSGDPNIGDVTFDQKTNKLQVDLVGHLDMAGKYVDTRKTVADTRKTIADPRQTIIDTRQTITDIQKTIIDTRQTITDTRKTISQGGKTISNPTYNQQIPNPNFGKNNFPNPTYNQQIPNPTYNQQIPNPNFGKNNFPNPTLGQQIANPNYLIGKSSDIARNSTGNTIFDAMLFSLAKTAAMTNARFQISEIAKITFNGEIDYAFSFSATDSGAIAGDRSSSDTTSHTGIYSWNKTVKDVPEPSTVIGFIVLGGIATIQRQQKMKKA